MKKYKIVYLNKGIKLNRDRDIEQAEDILNEYARSGWVIQQLVSPNDGMGVLYALMNKEKV